MRRALLVALMFAAVLPGVPAYAADSSVKCQTRSVPVTLSDTDPTLYRIAGSLCSKGSPTRRPVEVLVPGFTYDHTYWDFPMQPQTYSYAQSAAAAGYVTFALDRLGTGQSSYPPSALLTASAHVHALHQVVAYLRAQFPGSPVVGVGHSAGSGTVLQEVADNADVDGVILTGLLHEPDAADATFFGSFHPAVLDPKFFGSGYDAGYLTTAPGTRGPDFYNLLTADPLVIAQDETLKSTGSSEELASGDTAFLPSTSQSVHVPVLLAVGQDDASFCNDALGASCDDSAAVLARESGDFSPQACLEAYVLAGSGHDINLHPDAPQWFAAANDWVSRRTSGGCAAASA